MTDLDQAQQPATSTRRKIARYLLLSLLFVLLSGASLGGIWWWRTSQAVQRTNDKNKKSDKADKKALEKDKLEPTNGGNEREISHPLDPAIDFARHILDKFRSRVHDYSAMMIKQERKEGQLYPRTTMFTKVREQRGNDGQSPQPLSVYVRFDDPPAQRGREVIWVEGQNEGNLIVHEGGLLGFKRLLLEPTGVLAMAGSRYPITDAGIERLLEKMFARTLRDRDSGGQCELQFEEDATFGSCEGVRIVITHPTPDAGFDFYRAEVEIDPENFSYLRYAAYDWPTESEPEGQLIEEYIYRQVQINPGLTDSDFDPDNPLYKFP
uniref:DUF1571 domain-containing protein n=1 Tax=uncultured Rhizobium sp. HF0500_35F13 TaxID=723627 RepID=E7C633_9HYPH|nr:hypothetical protein [uncultured Rhizobium sp. HF0500_35F13]